MAAAELPWSLAATFLLASRSVIANLGLVHQLQGGGGNRFVILRDGVRVPVTCNVCVMGKRLRAR